MIREYGLEQVSPVSDSVVTVGIFDGVHRGHQEILSYVQGIAVAKHGTSTVVTFDPHPREVVRNQRVPLLTTIGERAAVLEALGVDRLVMIPFTAEFATLSAEQFVQNVLVQRVGMQAIVVGHDHGFGRGRAGDSAMLASLGATLGFTLETIPAQVVGAHVVSSSEIRALLAEEGAVDRAAEMLGRSYSLSGVVVEGDKRGRTIGFPTANVVPADPRKLVPLRGVYAVLVTLEGEAEGTRRAGMMNIGERPTFGGSELRLEVHLLDFSGDLYGRSIRVEFVERLREERRFGSVEGLVEQLNNDRERCRTALDALF